LIEKILNSLIKGWVSEYRFDSKRKWRFDFSHPELKIAIEIEGGVWSKGRHLRGQGFINDMEKYNKASLLGWKILRYTPQQINNIIGDLTHYLEEMRGGEKDGIQKRKK